MLWPSRRGFDEFTLNTKDYGTDGPPGSLGRVAFREVIGVSPVFFKDMLITGPPGLGGGIGPVTETTWTGPLDVVTVWVLFSETFVTVPEVVVSQQRIVV